MRTETDQSRKKKLTHTNFNLNKKHLHKFAMLREKKEMWKRIMWKLPNWEQNEWGEGQAE